MIRLLTKKLKVLCVCTTGTHSDILENLVIQDMEPISQQQSTILPNTQHGEEQYIVSLTTVGNCVQDYCPLITNAIQI